MKIYARSQNNRDLIKNLAGKDIWIYAQASVDMMLVKVYINIQYIQDNRVYAYSIPSCRIDLPLTGNKEAAKDLKSYLKSRGYVPDIVSYDINTLRVYPGEGIYTTSELNEIVRELINEDIQLKNTRSIKYTS